MLSSVAACSFRSISSNLLHGQSVFILYCSLLYVQNFAFVFIKFSKDLPAHSCNLLRSLCIAPYPQTSHLNQPVWHLQTQQGAILCRPPFFLMKVWNGTSHSRPLRSSTSSELPGIVQTNNPYSSSMIIHSLFTCLVDHQFRYSISSSM